MFNGLFLFLDGSHGILYSYNGISCGDVMSNETIPFDICYYESNSDDDGSTAENMSTMDGYSWSYISESSTINPIGEPTSEPLSEPTFQPTFRSVYSYNEGYMFWNVYDSGSCNGSVVKMQLFNFTSCLPTAEGSSVQFLLETGET